MVSTGKASARLDKGGGCCQKPLFLPEVKLRFKLVSKQASRKLSHPGAPTTEPSSLSPPTRQIQLHLQQYSIAYNYYLMTLKKCI